MNIKIHPALAITIIIIVAIITAGAIYFANTGSKVAQKQCTMEAKICPDGTAVGRTGPNCEFSPCPGGETKNNIVGNDRDEHGCIGSAGYTWCEEKQKCLRDWEENCRE